MKFWDEISCNSPSNLLGINECKTLMYARVLIIICIITLDQYYFSEEYYSRGIFSPFLCLVILLLVLPSNFIVARVKIRDSKICFNFKHDCIFYFIDIYSSQMINSPPFPPSFFFLLQIQNRMLDVSRTASYEIILVHLSVCQSVCPFLRPSLSFFKIGSLVFSDIVHDDR